MEKVRSEKMAKPKATEKDINAKKRAAVAAKKKQRGSLKDYFKGVKLEMKKVVWPTKKELGSYTAVVVAACAFFAIAFWAIDSGFLAVLRGLLGINM